MVYVCAHVVYIHVWCILVVYICGVQACVYGVHVCVCVIYMCGVHARVWVICV